MRTKRLSVDFNTCSLVRFSYGRTSVHFGVYPGADEVYKDIDGQEEVVGYRWWLWGRATELYDHCLEYFGVGPFMLVCWVP